MTALPAGGSKRLIYGRGVVLSVLLAALTGLPCYARTGRDQAAVRGRPFHIARQVIAANGVLVSRPNPLDERIARFLHLNNIVSLEEYSRWLQENMRYTPDPLKDSWAAPEETLKKKAGDCEDFAFLTSAVARVLGYAPRLMAMAAPGRAHAICVIAREGDTVIWFDNARMKRTPAKDLAEFFRHMAGRYAYAHVYDWNAESRTWALVYKNPDR